MAGAMDVQVSVSRWLRMTSSILVLLLVPALGQKVMVCYYSSDAQYRPYPGSFRPYNIDPSLCTHIIFAFVNIEGTQLVPQNWNDLGATGLYSQTVALKTRNPNLKVLLAVGGWVAGYEPFRDVVATENNMAEFAENVVTYLRTHGMDGLDMDWEFPGARGSPPQDKQKFTILLKTIQSTFEKEANVTKKDKLLLTLATAVGYEYIAIAYEPPLVHQHVDYMLLMTYNFHGGWDNVTGHPSSILSSKYDKGFNKTLCQTWSVNFWLRQGVPKSKMVLGLATYGMSFTLKDPSQNARNASVFGNGRGGRYTRQEGILAYYEICENIQKYGWNRVWVDEQEVPYATWRDQWVGYDDVTSIRIKAEKVINGMGLAGAFVWSVELDDFNGYCGNGRYPLLRTINSVIKSRNTPTPKDEVPLPKPEYPSADCDDGTYGTQMDPTNCRWYWYCVRGYEGYTKYTYRCPVGLAYDDTYKMCDLSTTCL